MASDFVGSVTGMTGQVLAALIAAFASLSISIIGLATSLRSARQLDRRQKRNALLKERADLIARDVELVQEARDALRKIIDATRGVLTTKEAIKIVSQIVAALSLQYTKHSATDEGLHLKAFHKAKITMLGVEKWMGEIPNGTKYIVDVSQEIRTEIIAARRELTEHQETLKNEQIKMVHEYVKF
jgi:hypothetical protein